MQNMFYFQEITHSNIGNFNGSEIINIISVMMTLPLSMLMTDFTTWPPSLTMTRVICARTEIIFEYLTNTLNI